MLQFIFMTFEANQVSRNLNNSVLTIKIIVLTGVNHDYYADHYL